MKRIFLDTNFIIDYFIREDNNGPCEQLLALGHLRGYKFFISYLTVANFAYIMRKAPKDSLFSMIRRINESFEIVENTQSQITECLVLNPDDFEDGLQYQSALYSKCDCIITRNQKDFYFSTIPVMAAEEYLASWASLKK